MFLGSTYNVLGGLCWGCFSSGSAYCELPSPFPGNNLHFSAGCKKRIWDRVLTEQANRPSQEHNWACWRRIPPCKSWLWSDRLLLKNSSDKPFLFQFLQTFPECLLGWGSAGFCSYRSELSSELIRGETKYLHQTGALQVWPLTRREPCPCCDGSGFVNPAILSVSSRINEFICYFQPTFRP